MCATESIVSWGTMQAHNQVEIELPAEESRTNSFFFFFFFSPRLCVRIQVSVVIMSPLVYEGTAPLRLNRDFPHALHTRIPDLTINIRLFESLDSIVTSLLYCTRL